jgi:hypothetical protein
MRASSQRREAADDPLMALVSVVREPRGDDQRPGTGWWLAPYYIRVAKNTPPIPLGHLSLSEKQTFE